MGVVYKARDTHLDRFVAIKVLRPDRVSDPERKRRFVQEAKAASALNHPNIVTVHDIDQRDGVDYIVMEYVAGKPLDELIPRKGMRLNEALKLAVQMADALAAAHEAGIVHRDLKPGNVMVTEKGHVKVLDFGLAKLTQAEPRAADATLTAPLTDENTILGSVNYMSPEQAQGLKVEARSDIFSFGAVLYEMVTGRRAFEGDSKMSALAAIINKEPAPLPPEVPHDLEKIISRSLRKDPARRFQTMADLKVALEELKEESESGTPPAAPATPRRRRWKLLIWPAALAGLLGIGAIAYWRLRPTPPAAPLEAVPLTSYPGIECCASFSPDGSQVAFAWNGETQDNFDIYIQVIGTGKPLRRTTDPAREWLPAWSPDGRYIAYRRGTQIVRIPALSGPESVVVEAAAGPPAWTPDSQWLAYSDRDAPGGKISLFLVSPASGEKRRLTQSPAGTLGDWCPAFSSDGRAFAFVRSSGAYTSDLYLQAVSGNWEPQGEPVRLTYEETPMGSLAWTADGRGLVYSAGPPENSTLWRIAFRDLPPRGGPLKPERVTLPGQSSQYVALSASSRRLAYTNYQGDINIWRADVPGSEKPSAQRRFISSTRLEAAPRFSPDGRRIVFHSARSGRDEIWVCDEDGSGEKQLTWMNARMTGSPRWSPDGKWIVYDSDVGGQFEVYVIRADGGRPRRLTTDPATDAVASWSRDGKRIYFVSNRSGRWQIWAMPAEGGEANQVTRNGGYVAFESWDGKFLYYTMSIQGQSGLFRVPVEGGDETQVVDAVLGGAFAVAERGIYFIPPADRSGNSSIQFFEFSTGRTTTVVPVENPQGWGMTVSPDGRVFLYLRSEQQEADLMLVENFR